MATFNPYDQYLNVQFGTADQGTLILMTFDGAIRFCRTAEECMANGDKINKGKWLSQAFDTVAELRKSLKPDIGGEMADQLSRTYEFICHQITLANVFDRHYNLVNALMVLERLRETWKEIIQERRQAAAGAGLIG